MVTEEMFENGRSLLLGDITWQVLACIWGHVMITNFCDFCLFLALKICPFLRNKCHDQIFAKTSSSFSKKRQIFRRKNHNIGPANRGFL
jgi:hypothetical protein